LLASTTDGVAESAHLEMQSGNLAAMRSARLIVSAFVAFSAFSVAIMLAHAADAAELIMYRRDGCPWCAKWDREIGPIYPKTEFNQQAPLRLINLDHDRDLPIKHGAIRYTPTFVLVENGKEVARMEGYPGEDYFWPRLTNLFQMATEAGAAATPAPAPEGAPPPGASVIPR
jgi:hypothetical protein